MNPQQIVSRVCPSCNSQIPYEDSGCLCGHPEDQIEEATVARFPDLKLVGQNDAAEMRFFAADELDEFSEAFEELDSMNDLENARAKDLPNAIEIPAEVPENTTAPAITETVPSFQTLIERPPLTQTIVIERPVEKGNPFLSWLQMASLLGVAAFGGGLAVYLFTPTAVQQTSTSRPADANTGVTDLVSTDAFVSRSSSGSAADEPLIPENTALDETKREKPVHPLNLPTRLTPETNNENTGQSPSTVTGTQLDSDKALSGSTPAIESNKEAKVGAYVVERPAGRKPTAKCADGTFSYASSNSAACAQRGGVSAWLGEGKAIPQTNAPNVAYILGPKGGCYYLSRSNEKIYVDKKHCN